MNIKLHDVIASLAGASGMAVVRAIVAGERSPHALFALCDIQIRSKNEQAVIEALRGTWADEHIFALAQALQSWDHYQKFIAACDTRIAAILPPHDDTQRPLPKTSKRASVNAPDIAHLREILAQMCGGQDMTQLPALTQYSVLQLIGEVGTNLNAWPTENTSPPGSDWRPATRTVANAREASSATATGQDGCFACCHKAWYAARTSRSVASTGAWQRAAAA